VAKLDYIFIRDKHKGSLNFSLICNDIETSDPYPVMATFQYDQVKPESKQNTEQKLFQKFNWNNQEFTTKIILIRGKLRQARLAEMNEHLC